MYKTPCKESTESACLLHILLMSYFTMGHVMELRNQHWHSTIK